MVFHLCVADGPHCIAAADAAGDLCVPMEFTCRSYVDCSVQSDRQIPGEPQRDNEDDHDAGCPASPLAVGMGVAPPCDPLPPPGVSLDPLPSLHDPLMFGITSIDQAISVQFTATSAPLYLTVRALLRNNPLVPTLRVGTPARTLRVRSHAKTCRDAERRQRAFPRRAWGREHIQEMRHDFSIAKTSADASGPGTDSPHSRPARRHRLVGLYLGLGRCPPCPNCWTPLPPRVPAKRVEMRRKKKGKNQKKRAKDRISSFISSN